MIKNDLPVRYRQMQVFASLYDKIQKTRNIIYGNKTFNMLAFADVPSLQLRKAANKWQM